MAIFCGVLKVAYKIWLFLFALPAPSKPKRLCFEQILGSLPSKMQLFDLSELEIFREMRVDACRHVAVVAVSRPNIYKRL